ncbi:amino acid ABC transporter permease [Marinitenerispora sediminis]|uniref:Amino acid ABC transporter permease n=2 Tax=Marinitenerispora sediminis TaxID=1931232 RepID=A0A368T0E3_9ACTN|nr:amino acid ABC transporter permease [Marinitenerispora sediminis]RCV49084.1 amino acid ABC transporter permease [Marinitenerispora sediminis]RCV52386.1 amino acid ABC transporter permease [Marinitenerispora sediminis]
MNDKPTTSGTAKRPRRQAQASVLYDAPGPQARLRYNVYTFLTILGLLLVAWFVFVRMDEREQWEAEKWQPFFTSQLWTTYVLPGLGGTLGAAAVAAVLALAFGMVFGIARLSDHVWVRIPAAVVVEFFRAIPLLIMIFFLMRGSWSLFGTSISTFWAVVLGLMFYNGSVLAEIVRAGIQSIPRGQSEAALSIGLRKGAVTRLILLPQAITAMLPAIIAQLVVLLKDTALGYVIGYSDLLNQWRNLSSAYINLIPAAIVIALIYIALNVALGYLATWLERRNQRSVRSQTKAVTGPAEVGVSAAGPTAGGGAAGPRA